MSRGLVEHEKGVNPLLDSPPNGKQTKLGPEEPELHRHRSGLDVDTREVLLVETEQSLRRAAK